MCSSGVAVVSIQTVLSYFTEACCLRPPAYYVTVIKEALSGSASMCALLEQRLLFSKPPPYPSLSDYPQGLELYYTIIQCCGI